jgi:hypothetical protein
VGGGRAVTQKCVTKKCVTQGTIPTYATYHVPFVRMQRNISMYETYPQPHTIHTVPSYRTTPPPHFTFKPGVEMPVKFVVVIFFGSKIFV